MHVIAIGDFIITMEYRRAGGDEGPALSLIAPLPPLSGHQTTTRREVWRADLFKKAPHEHWQTPAKEDTRHLTDTEKQDPFAWCHDRLTSVATILTEAGYPEVADNVDQASFSPKLQEITQTLHQLDVAST